MDVGLIIRHIGEHMRTEGAGGAIRWMSRRAQWRWQEWRYGIHTEGIIQNSELGIDNAEAGEYHPTDYTDFARMMRAVELEPSEHVFVDYGAGMGRVMILAADYPFRRVIGIEHSETLVTAASRNIESCRARLACRNIEVVNGDAAEYSLPKDASVLYFNNPFFGSLLERVLDKVHELASNSVRPILLICNLPMASPFEDQLKKHDWLEQKNYLPLNDFRHCSIFRTRPVTVPAAHG